MMAQCPEARDLLAEELTCSICLCTYQEPVSLNCGHSFCRTCILQAFDSQKDLARVYSCPVCQAKYDQIPELQKNFQLCNIVQTLSGLHEKESTDPVIPCSYCLGEPDPAVKTCLNCEVSLCQQHLDKHYNKSHVMLEPTESLLERKCSEHGKLIEYYCEDDCSCVCVACYVVGFHKGHTLMTLNAARTKVMATFSQRISSLQGSKDDLGKDIQELEKGLETLQKNESKLSLPISDLSDNICSQVKKQCQVVLNAITTYKTIKTWEIEALTKEMHRKREEALAALAKLETLRGQSEDSLFLKDFQACQERLSALNFQMDTLQVFDVAVDEEVVERIEDETASYISEINCILRGVHRIISVQAKQLVWKNGSRITVEPKLDKGVFLENPVQLDMKFEDLSLETLTL